MLPLRFMPVYAKPLDSFASRWMCRTLTAYACIALVHSMMPQCASAQAMTGTVVFAEMFDVPKPMVGVNSTANEYGPVWQQSQERLLFTSEQSGSAAVFQAPYELRGSNHTPMPHPSVIVDGTFNADGRWRGYVSFGKDGEAVGVAFVTHDAQAWPTIVTVPTDGTSLNEGHTIPTILRNGFDSQPTLSPDGTRLVYSSDREGGLGGLDLWVCERRMDLEWDMPVLLSSKVNSEGNEITPYFMSADSLVYASNGYGGKGGYDLFLTVLEDGVWQEPEPLEWFNTEFNESDPTRLPDGSLVFASDRPGGTGGFDLWIAFIKNVTWQR